jgi:signal-transduction protein with cAMP-binding, CBS, and nucleotidyltransferase domain
MLLSTFKVQRTFAEKRKSCITCDFYQHVQEQAETSIENQKLLKFFSEDRTGKLLLDLAECRYVRAGERIVNQGEITDKAYIIKRGSCLVIVEKDGQSHPMDHRRRGDIIGAIPILTGEPQTAHVEAETDVELWGLDSSMLNNISTEHPDFLKSFKNEAKIIAKLNHVNKDYGLTYGDVLKKIARSGCITWSTTMIITTE